MIGFLLLGAAVWYFMPQISAALPKVSKPAVCNVVRHDGPFEICLTRDASGKWSWHASRLLADGKEESHTGGPGYASDDVALADAWVRLASIDVAQVIGTPRDAYGLRLETTGRVHVVSLPIYLNAVAPLITAASDKGDDAAGIVISLLTSGFGLNWNPLRVQIAGGTLQDAAARYDAARKLPNVTPQSLAKAIMGVPA